MKWFYNLRRSVRIIIAICAWLPLFIFAGAISGSVGENGENVQMWQSLVIWILLALGVVFTVFAVIARSHEKKAEKSKQNTVAESQPAPTPTPAVTSEQKSTAAADFAEVHFPINTKIRGVTFQGRQKYLAESNIGDVLSIRHTPTSEYPNTIAVINTRTGKNLGNLGSDLADKLLAAFDDGCVFDGEIVEITGGNGSNYGCNIVIDGAASRL